MNIMDRSVCFGEDDNSHIEIVEDMLKEFAQLGQEVTEGRLKKAWGYVASSERRIIDIGASSIPGKERVIDMLKLYRESLTQSKESYLDKIRMLERILY